MLNPFSRLFSTEHHKNWWKNRKIDWKTDYLSTFNHPHRLYLCEQLKTILFSSIFEIGCGAGANLVPIGFTFPRVALGGSDINPDAIETARQALPRDTLFEVSSADNLMMSDKSCDVVLSDMCLIYVGPRKIEQYLREAKRVARRHLVLVEFYHPSWFARIKMTLGGRYTHDYPKLLEKIGCSDIVVRKMPEHLWPGARDNHYRHIIIART